MIKCYYKILAIELEIRVYDTSLHDFLQGKDWSFN